MANAELQIEMAMRDQVIHNQREALRNLWNMLFSLGLNQKQIAELASKQGLTIEGGQKLSPENGAPVYAPTACFVQHHHSSYFMLSTPEKVANNNQNPPQTPVHYGAMMMPRPF
jgi:kinesin family member 18/19